MADLALTFGSDLVLAPNGDLALASGPLLTEQRVLRRLLTNAGSYIWQLNYGAGLAQFVGQPGATATIAGVVRTQLMQESRVAAMPAPQTTVTADKGGNINMTVRYADSATMQTIAVSVPL